MHGLVFQSVQTNRYMTENKQENMTVNMGSAFSFYFIIVFN